MTFHEVRFPSDIALAATGGPMRKTEVVTLGSGFEERNAVWVNSRRSYNAGYGVKTIDDLHVVLAFFEARNAKLYGFRLKDWLDYKSSAPLTALAPTDQVLGNGDGAKTAFQLVKVYSSGPGSWSRTIAKPVAGTVRVAKAGVEAIGGWTVDTATGIVTFGVAPALGVEVTAGYEFDVPVRFDTDTLSINLQNFRNGEIPSIPLVEIRL